LSACIGQSCEVTHLGAVQVVEGLDGIEPQTQLSPKPHSDGLSLIVVTAFLDAALRLWDDDRGQAKSQVKVAAAMLRDLADYHTCGALLPGSVPAKGGLATWQARKVKEFIDASLTSRIRLGDCASKARLSKSHFSRAFKATFGTTVGRYVWCQRVERAKRLMLVSREPLSQIALTCGFGGQAHYCRVFRDVVGTSPNSWRRQNMLSRWSHMAGPKSVND
jgi:AraC family transcriptional regulator